jgi:hypothetical protein
MIDAIGTSNVQATALRASSQSASRYATAPVESNSGGFVTSRIRVDNLLDIAILEVRSSDTGDVIRQFPTEYQIQVFERAERAATRDGGPRPSAAAVDTSAALSSRPPVYSAQASTTAPAPSPSAPQPQQDDQPEPSVQSVQTAPAAAAATSGAPSAAQSTTSVVV